MNFKEYVASDIDGTFIELEEFASEKNINGVSVKVVEDADRLEYRIKDGYEKYGGLIQGDILFFISYAEYAKIPMVKPIPVTDQAIRYNGKPMIVIDVKELEGIYEIILKNAGGY